MNGIGHMGSSGVLAVLSFDMLNFLGVFTLLKFIEL